MKIARHLEDMSYSVVEEIESHPAWRGNITGLEAEDLLKDNPPFTFLIRKGEKSMNYYISFIQRDGSLKHQPLLIVLLGDKWCYRNATKGIPTQLSFIHFVHKIIHCEPRECQPLI